jgi:hypothetical protein
MVKGISTHYMEWTMRVIFFLPFITQKEEIAKKEEELEQKAWDDELAVTHYFKKAGGFLYLIGEDWPSYEVFLF